MSEAYPNLPPDLTPDLPPDPQRSARRALRVARARHWRRTRKLTALLLLGWFGATFCTVFFARELSTMSLAGWPLSFYLAAQGASLAYLAIIGAYALGMERMDRRFARELAREPAQGTEQMP
jgi:putative solute:sodium symporter small subunit